MVTIVKGNEKIVCSYKTYEDQFKQYGYVIASEVKKAPVKKTEVKVEPVLKEEVKEEAKEETKEQIQEETKTEEEKIGTKYGVRRRTSTKKEE